MKWETASFSDMRHASNPETSEKHAGCFAKTHAERTKKAPESCIAFRLSENEEDMRMRTQKSGAQMNWRRTDLQMILTRLLYS